ncbi:sulfate transporter : Sulfate permease-like transporter, MFS superfamily OS=Singulisphaera acidiphila (strain ATCC BAA-1392 / DSM 18658 / VKM B-2454 / MOB10) GN=Sinac_3353 PE=4 SV=1: Sulfate_tra_GLY: Sulfate_transp: Pro_CA [Gemmata massiliana]|uniref:SLC26A/SulP transporter domain-containing protein n=1 Tax=Gemmata massiliana TaxID=1210884 RepID=A0A6P2DDR0_9BACT|nr:SulP family inorganic anion transporter [Gemmata massiliana]VTR98545.1 sulfate transporter : Sulfate permease-like transporter, MFS superfamily OS=Singulisphaera acidiphila (strain ATCC BAA-1392 / DSM 18658 / VKM B-2454 / MOB10) GN=Sinac_3353 PE=4 SV=1: Sulfate_tra_GLY: Sulfate_transp: Pro_CA [Gemmata massiliana]
MTSTNGPTGAPLPAGGAALPRDLAAGLVVFLVALPLCLGVALASNAPLFAGVVAGVVGGILVGVLSGSHTSVSGPAAGLTAVVGAQLVALGSFPAFLMALVLAGLIQIVLGIVRGGFIAAFFPSSVIKGLLAAIGVILILKQIPHVVGHDADPEGDMAFQQPDEQSTFSELVEVLGDLHPGAAVIGVLSIALLVVWGRWKVLKTSLVPAPLVVVLLGVGLSFVFRELGGSWAIGSSHLVQVPVAGSAAEFFGFLQAPDFARLARPAVYTAALTLAAVASLETLLNLEAVDKLDPRRRVSPPNRELMAQGAGNVVCGLLGGLPVTSVIVRSSVNIHAGGRTKRATVVHGLLLLGSVALLAPWLNLIPLSCLAAILLVTGIKLASPALVRRMWAEGRAQFLPFVTTVIAIVFTDLLVGVLIGLAVSAAFILWSNARRPIRVITERHLSGEVVRVELANQVSFLNRAALADVLDAVPAGGHVLLDATGTDYIDPDVLELLREFAEQTGPARGVSVSRVGFRSRYRLADQTQFVDYSTRELQAAMTPEQVVQVLKDGHERFRTGQRLTRDLGRQVEATAAGQHPLAVVLSCIDSRTPAELIFDLGVGDVFSVRVAGNVTSRKILGSIEYGCAVAGAKLIVVMGHTRCGAVGAAVDLVCSAQTAAEATGCQHLDHVITAIQRSVDPHVCHRVERMAPAEKQAFVNTVARENVRRSVADLLGQSETLAGLVKQGRIMVAGALYDVATGGIEFLSGASSEPLHAE